MYYGSNYTIITINLSSVSTNCMEERFGDEHHALTSYMEYGTKAKPSHHC